LKKQTERWTERYQSDAAFRKKRQLRDKSRMKKGVMDNLKDKICSNCGSNDDLQRHHESYSSTDYIIFCRKCHNLHHACLKNEQLQVEMEE
jgi:hypothetical protein